MKILGIHDGHNAGATLFSDGKIIASICEERITRFKNEPGYPRKAIDKILEMTSLASKDIDLVALGSKFIHSREFYFNFNWYKKDYRDQLIDEGGGNERAKYFFKERLNERKKQACEHLGISLEKVLIIEHHLAHAAAAYFGSPWADSKEKVLILTLDGSGDGLCSTVNIGQNGKITRIAETKSSASLGKIYSRVTYLLGMKPWEHEYKIMGLAPYADKNRVENSYQIIKDLIDLNSDTLTFYCKTKLSMNYCYPYLKAQFENHRFDWIAGAVQKLQEDLITKWVKSAIAKTGISKIVCGGGSFMNVKTNLKILDLPEVEDFFVFPSCGDESISIGVAFQAYVNELGNGARIESLGPIYLGPEFSKEEIANGFKKMNLQKKYQVDFEDNINEKVASLLARGEIVARFNGPMEWGARALGNRSILMNPKNSDRVKELNAAIKKRDFWMPFAPTILSERQNDYLLNPKGIKAAYMTLAFNTTKKGSRDLAAALHPYDLTVRPQILERETNPGYYEIIKRFERITGIGAILNTSFNLHGEPIVCTPQDAINTFEKSGLKFLALDDYLISKK